MNPIIAGLTVSFMSFAFLQFVVLKYARSCTLLCLILALVGGQLAALAFPDPDDGIYRLSWMTGMLVSVLAGTFVRILKRQS